MTRRLLPYEHDLIATLGVTEEEYLNFLSIQEAYSDPKEGTIVDIRNMPPAGAAIAAAFAAATATTAGTLALISTALTVVGILFQVAAVLLAEKPSGPKAARNQRDKRFSPRFGFNSSQELAQYGDPINLVYCNTSHNPLGGVRIGTSLVWSAVESYGSTQFMQLLLVLGAASIKTIDYDRVAFGQLPLGQFSAANTWLYYEDNGPVNFNNKVLGDGKDPTRDGAASSEDVCRVMFAKNRRDGYSQAFSPSSLTSIGVYDPIPLNVEIQERRSSGRPQWRDLQVTIQGDNYGTGNNVRYGIGNTITVIFGQARKRQDKVAQEAAKEMRYQLVSALDQAATYMLGTAKFKLVSVQGFGTPDREDLNLDNSEVRARFECIEAGRRPVTDYSRTKIKLWNEDDRELIEEGKQKLKDPVTEARITGPGFLQNQPSKWNLVKDVTNEDDYTYTISYGTLRSGTLDGGNLVNNPDDVFNGSIRLPLKAFGGQDWNFKDSKIVNWTTELDQKRSASIPQGGSIAVTRVILESFLANKPKLDTKQLKDEINDDLEKIKQTIDDLNSNNFDKSQFRKRAKEAASAIRKSIKDKKKNMADKMDELKINENDIRRISGENVLGNKTNLNKKFKNVIELDDKITDLEEERNDIMSDDISVAKKALINFYRNTNSSFRDLNGNLYSTGGIKAMKRRLTEIKGRFTTDQNGVKAVRDSLKDLIKDKEEALNLAKDVSKNWEDLAGAADDDFFTKCLVKTESAAYQTVTACDYVKFAIRCKLFRRVSGRAKDYGENEAPDGFRLSDNGLQGRMAFFKVSYKQTNSAGAYSSVPIVFAVRRTADQDNFIGLAFKGPTRAKWEFKIDPIGDIGAEVRETGQNKFAFIENSGGVKTFDHNGASFGWTGSKVDITGSNEIKAALKERGPLYTNEWDLFSVRSDTQVQFSFDGGPEFRITSVTEQQVESVVGKYSELSTMALGIFSGRGVQDLRAITAYVTQGKSSWIVNESTGARTYSADSTSYAPDIFADTVLDRANGIGKYAKSEGIDWNGLALAKRFCKNNGLGTQLFMDGVIADIVSWRQFWVENAPFSLLEFARVGGRETLIPAIPTSATGVANRQVNISALFTIGNILEGSYKEEFIDYGDATQDIIATVIYRETETQDVFPRNASVQVKLADAVEDNAIRQTFDASQFVTLREQAILFGKLVCNQRRHIRRGIEFKTFPTDSPISPGAYIYVDIGLQTWDGITSGVIMEGGELNAPLTDGIANGSYSVLTYKNDQPAQSFAGVGVTNGTASSLASKAGYMFVLGAQSNRKRVFRVTEVQMDEEGEVTVKAIEHPCEAVGSQLLSRIANFSGELFDVR
jgi:hypothetical protein